MDIIKVSQWMQKDFKNHRAAVRELDGITEVIWKAPDPGINSIVYLLRKNYLYVGGDLGSAVYVWSSAISLHFLADCSLDYFQGKCEASETGGGFEEWDTEKAEKRIRNFPKDYDWFDLSRYKELKKAMLAAASSQ